MALALALGSTANAAPITAFTDDFSGGMAGWNTGPSNQSTWSVVGGQMYATAAVDTFVVWSPHNHDYIAKSFPEVPLNDFTLTLKTTFDSSGPGGQGADENALGVAILDAAGTSGYIVAFTSRTGSSYLGAWIKRIDNGVLTPTPADEGGVYNTGLLIWDRYTPPGYTTESRRIYDENGNMVSNTPLALPYRINDNVHDISLSRVGDDLTFTMTGANISPGQSVSLSVTDPHLTKLTDFGSIRLFVYDGRYGYRFDNIVFEGELVPEPASLALLALGGLLVGARRRVRH